MEIDNGKTVRRENSSANKDSKEDDDCWWCVCDVLPCMHHYGAFCPGSRFERQPTPHSKPLPIMCWHHRTHYHQRSVERKEERTKTSYSMNINLITKRLSIAANRPLVNRLSYSTSRIWLTTSSCASPRHDRDLSSIFCRLSVKTITSSLQSVAHIFLNY